MTLEEHRRARDAYERKMAQACRRTTVWKIVARVLTFATIPTALYLALVLMFHMNPMYAAVAGGLLSVPFNLAILDKIDSWLHDRSHRDALRIHDELFSGANGGSR